MPDRFLWVLQDMETVGRTNNFAGISSHKTSVQVCVCVCVGGGGGGGGGGRDGYILEM